MWHDGLNRRRKMMSRKRIGSGRGTSAIFLLIAGFVFVNIVLTWFAESRLDAYETLSSAGPESLPSKQKDIAKRRRHRTARKTMPPRESSQNSVGFVHLGKTGGSTISKLLRNGCTSFVVGSCRNVTNESMVSKMVEHYYHVPDFHRLPTAKHQSFIVTVRDVYDRTVSSFLYHHPKNAGAYKVRLTRANTQGGPLAYSCFETLEDFASLMKGNTTECHYPYRQNMVDADDCSALACAAVHGKVRFFIHLFFNFQNILYTKIPNDPPRHVYAIRQERLWEDWEGLNVMFGQTDSVYIPTSDANERNISGVQLPVDRTISKKGRSKLCKALETEYVAYFQILQKALNLEMEDLEASVQVAEANCPNLDFRAMLRNPS